jgi:GDP-mannose 4,6-dehydratase
MVKILITGITGFVGSHLCEYLLSLPNASTFKIYGLVRWRSPLNNIQHCVKKIELVYGDLLDSHSINEVIWNIEPDIIFHLAAQSYVPYSFIAPASTLDVNGLGTLNLLEAVKAGKIQAGYNPVVHICSSSEVYGQVTKEDVPIKENTPFRPASPYGVSKVCEDMLAYQYWTSYGIKTLRTRMFTHTGPRRGEVFVTSNFVKQVVEIKLGIKKPVIYVGNLDSIRTFVDVRDTVKAYWQLVTKCPPGEVYNIGGDFTESVGDMLNRIIRLAKLPKSKTPEIIQEESRIRPSDVTLQIPCSDKFKQATGWKPTISFDTTLLDMLEYWKCELISPCFES